MSDTEVARVAAARGGNQQEFRALTDPHRRELTVHCYRMLGSIEDAEDALQDTLLRAWKGLDTFDGRAPFRAWLYRIATNASLDLYEKRKRRTLPVESHPAARPGEMPAPPVEEVEWVTPFPDADLVEATLGNEAIHSARESITLAFVVALQHLPARQRAVLLLRDVMGMSAAEVAELLDGTVAAVNSALQRARATLEEKRGPLPAIPDEKEQRALLARYVKAWERGDVDGLVALFSESATFAMPPSPTWYLGHAGITDLLRNVVFTQPGAHAKQVPFDANGQPAFGSYVPRPDGGYALLGIHLVTIDRDRIASAISFLDPALVARFGLPATLP